NNSDDGILRKFECADQVPKAVRENREGYDRSLFAATVEYRLGHRNDPAQIRPATYRVSDNNAVASQRPLKIFSISGVGVVSYGIANIAAVEAQHENVRNRFR